MKKTILWLLTVPLAFLLFLIGYDVYEYLWSKYGVLTMRKP